LIQREPPHPPTGPIGHADCVWRVQRGPHAGQASHQFFVSIIFPRRGATRRNTMSDAIKHVSDTSFDTDVIQSDQPVLVDYWAEWCGPCKMIAPILEEAAAQYAGKLTVAKLNVDDNQATASKFGIRGIPTLMLFKGGQVVATKVGALSKSQLTAFLDGSL
jgi:thioredoxin 1